MRFYFLVSNHIHLLNVGIGWVPKEQLQIVINTTNKDNEKSIEEYCKDRDISYIITESDGTPATGKNSLLKCFLDSEDDYAVCVDGDDIITPSGVEFYTELSHNPRAPDLLCLYKQVVVNTLSAKQWLRLGMTFDDFPKHVRPRYGMDKSLGHVFSMNEREIFEFLEMQCSSAGEDIDDELYKEWARERYIFQQIMNQYSEEYEYMCRMVWWSRKAAKLAHYENDLVVGEDTVQFMRLKKLADEQQLRMYKKIDGRSVPPTYLQNQIAQGVSRKLGSPDWGWTTPLNRKLEYMIANDEMPPPRTSLPDWSTN